MYTQDQQIKIIIRRAIRQWEYEHERGNHPSDMRDLDKWADKYYLENIKQQQQNDSQSL